MLNAAKCKALREQLGLSQTALGKLVGVSLHSIFRLENGTRQPKADELEKIAHALGVTTDELMTAPSEDNKKAPAGMAANGGDNYGIQLNNSENNGTITQTTVSNAPASSAVDADLEAALRLRHERPEIIKLLADKDFTAAQIRALASAPRDEKDKD